MKSRKNRVVLKAYQVEGIHSPCIQLFLQIPSEYHDVCEISLTRSWFPGDVLFSEMLKAFGIPLGHYGFDPSVWDWTGKEPVRDLTLPLKE